MQQAMSYVNGAWMDAANAVVPMEDRGHQFGDGVYEVVAFFSRRLVDAAPHVERLERSLQELKIPNPYGPEKWLALLQQTIDKNGYEHGGVYLQVTRGAYKRDHSFKAGVNPGITLSAFGQKTPPREVMDQGVRVIAQPDIRWKRCDIKTINLLPNVLAKQAAVDAGVRETLLLKENGEITEASVANFFAVIGGVIRTHPATNEILNGITRQAVIGLAKEAGYKVEESAFTLHELEQEAEESFLTSTTSNVLPVVRVNDAVIGGGTPGPVSLRLLELYVEHVKRQTDYTLWS